MNPLIVDKISKRFLYEKDSGFLYTRQLISSLPTDWHFTVLTPRGFNRDFFDNNHIIKCVEYDYSTSIHQNRYHFNRNILSNTLSYTKDIDVVINNQPEVTANLRVFFKIQRREYPLIINLFHWIDCAESSKFATDLSGFIFRQVEGFNNADLNLFHTNHAFDLFVKSANNERLPHTANDLSKVNFFHPLPTLFGMNPIDLPDKKIVLFNHRLNNTTGWKEVLDICKKLHEEKDDFILWFTDENKDEHTNTNYDWVITKSVSFESYGYLLSNAYFSVCNLQGYATWNMAVLDTMNHGTPVISNDTQLMTELGTITTGDLKHTIIKMLSTTIKLKPHPRIFTDFNYECWVINTIKKRVDGKCPLKYNDVKDYINNTTKKELVNHFWKFHANSNFQKIRWLLLSEGYNDDTSLDYTLYNKPGITPKKTQLLLEDYASM